MNTWYLTFAVLMVSTFAGKGGCPVVHPTSDAVSTHWPYRSATVREARAQLRAQLLECGLPGGVIDDAVAVLSELVANAVQHAQAIRPGVVITTWQVEADSVRISVTDGGSPHPIRVVPAESLAESGRGLHMVQALAVGWGVRDHPQGARTVWARVSLPPS